MNSLPCGDCINYDPILAREEQETLRGWCIARSLYPAKEGPGQVFPPNAQRHEDPKALGTPFIVKKMALITACPYARKGKPEAAELKRQAQQRLSLTKKGQRVLS